MSACWNMRINREEWGKEIKTAENLTRREKSLQYRITK